MDSRPGSARSEMSALGAGDVANTTFNNLELSRNDTRDSSQRTWRNVIGYHNAPQFNVAGLDQPPEYEESISGPSVDQSWRDSPLNPTKPRRRASRDADAADADADELPRYYCSVQGEGPVEMRVESQSPFQTARGPLASEWKGVYVVLRGTLFSVHQIKYPGLFSKDHGEAGETAGKLIKKYNLQHAEVGSAADHKKVEWVPRPGVDVTTLDSYVPDDPNIFQPVRQYVIRLRLEGDQLLMRLRSGFMKEEWLKILCGAIDIAGDLDERVEPRQMTLPRRNRRRQDENTSQDLLAVTTVEEQERIIRENFPQLANGRTTTSPADGNEEDLERGIFSSETNSSSGATSIDSASHLIPRSVDPDFDVEPGKWSPRLLIDSMAEARARKQCMPVLLANSRRHGPFVMQGDKLFRMDWESQELVPFPEQPPAYQRSSKRSTAGGRRESGKSFFKFRSLAEKNQKGSKKSKRAEVPLQTSPLPRSIPAPQSRANPVSISSASARFNNVRPSSVATTDTLSSINEEQTQIQIPSLASQIQPFTDSDTPSTQNSLSDSHTSQTTNIDRNGMWRSVLHSLSNKSVPSYKSSRYPSNDTYSNENDNDTEGAEGGTSGDESVSGEQSESFQRDKVVQAARSRIEEASWV